jgi:membrane dipeptidase
MSYRWLARRALIGGAMLLASACASSPLPDGVTPEAMAIHNRLLTLDTHLDTPANLERPNFDIRRRQYVERDGTNVDLPRMDIGGLDGGFWVVYMGQGPLTPEGYATIRDRALLRTLAIHRMVAANPDDFALALTSADAARIAAEGKKVVYISIENSYPLGEDPSLIDTFYKLGVRMIGPVHNGNNQFADSTNPGASPPVSWNGLSPRGLELVKRANELGMVLDGSHASDEAISQMIDASATPIILSHHGADGLYEHPRNAPDDLLKKLAAKGGVTQMNALGAFLKQLTQSPERMAALSALRAKYGAPDALAPERFDAYLDELAAINTNTPEQMATFDDYMDQVLYNLKLLGVDHVGFGADWDGGGGLAGFRDVTALPRVTARLLAEGYTEADLQKMWSGNVLRVLKAAEDHAASLKK